MAQSGTTITLTRALSRDQQARRERLVLAALDLAIEGGYAAVTMHDVADRAQVSRATVYRYFTSKNHLLSEVSALWIGRAIEDLTARELPDAPQDRLSTMLCLLVELSAEYALLAEAVVQAATSADPSAEASHGSFQISIKRITSTAYQGVEVPDAFLADLDTVLGHILLSGLVSLTCRGRSSEEVQGVMRTAVRLLASHSPSDT